MKQTDDFLPTAKLVTRSQAAKYFLPGSESSYNRWEKKGLLKPVRLNGPNSRKLYRVEDLKALINQMSAEGFKEAAQDETEIYGEAFPNDQGYSQEFVSRAIELYNEGNGLSLGQIAKALRVPKSTIHKWVNGSRRSIDVAAQQ